MKLDRNNIIILVIIAVIAILMIYVFAISAGVKKVSLDTVMTLNGTEYSLNEFQKYVYINNDAAGDIAAETSQDQLYTYLDQFSQTKIYAYAATTKNITLPEETIDEYKATYAEKANVFAQYGITEEDYLRFAEDDYKENELLNNFSSYYELPEKYYNDIYEAYSGDQKTYTYRLMYFAYEDTDDSTEDLLNANVEISGDELDETPEEEEEDRSRETVFATVEDVLNQLNAGGDFEELAKEYASYRFTFSGAGYTIVNGDLEYATTPLIESKLGSDMLYARIQEMEAGQTSEIIEDPESNSLYILRLENVEDGFVGEGDVELREILISNYQDTLIMQGINYSINQSTLFKILYQ